MKQRVPHRRGRRGQLLILAPIFVIAFCGIAALCIDVGHFCTSKSVLQNAADAGALASVMELWEQRANPDSSDESANRNAARNEATAICQINTSRAGVLAEFGVWNGSSFSPADHSVAVNAVRVTATRNASAPGGPVASLFARALGVNSLDQDGVAVARFKHPGLLPFAVEEDSLVPVGDSLTMYDATETVPGNCGLLDFDGGENSAADTREWATNGYEGGFYIDPLVGYKVVEGTPGLVSTVMAPVMEHIALGEPVISLIYRSVVNQGALADYTIVGYAAMVITGYGTSDKQGEELNEITALVTGIYMVDSGETEGKMDEFMLLQLVE